MNYILNHIYRECEFQMWSHMGDSTWNLLLERLQYFHSMNCTDGNWNLHTCTYRYRMSWNQFRTLHKQEITQQKQLSLFHLCNKPCRRKLKINIILVNINFYTFFLFSSSKKHHPQIITTTKKSPSKFCMYKECE